MAKSAIVAGANGLIGSHCLRQLARSDRYDRIVALVRNSTPGQHCRVALQPVDYESIEQIDLPRNADVFCSLGTTLKKAGSKDAFRRVDHGYVTALARRALARGCEQFLVVSSISADARTSNFYLRVKGEMEADISAMPFRAVHIFRPSFLIGERAESRPAEAAGIAAARSLQFLLVGSLRRYRPIEASAVGRAMVNAATREDAGRFVHEYDDIQYLANEVGPGAR